MAVRERLWTLIALDNMVAERDRQLVDQDAQSGEWVLCHPGEQTAVTRSGGRYIPADERKLQKRVEDELVRLALAAGCDRGVLADTLGLSERVTWSKERRAQAYDISLAAVGGGATGADGA